MYTNNYSIIERFNKVIAKTIWCSFFVSQCRWSPTADCWPVCLYQRGCLWYRRSNTWTSNTEKLFYLVSSRPWPYDLVTSKSNEFIFVPTVPKL